MKRSLLAWILLSFITLTNFTNCDVYSNNSAFLAQSTDCGDLCSGTASADMLEIRINVPDTPSNFGYPSALTQFDLGGDCNEGGFSTNVIHWYITNTRTQTVVRDSNTIGANSICKWGRFSLLFDTGTVLTEQHTLTAEIIGVDQYAQRASNQVIGRYTVYLNPQ